MKLPFTRKKKAIETDVFTSLIASGMVVKGEVFFDGTLKIEGNVSGPYIGSSPAPSDFEHLVDTTVMVDKSGVVHSDLINCTNVIIAGNVYSKKIRADGLLRITKDANISGAQLYFRQLDIEEGAKIHECELKNIDMLGDNDLNKQPLKAA